MKAKSDMSTRQAISPNSSPTTAKVKSVWASGQHQLRFAAARSGAHETAILEGLHRRIDLEGVALVGVEEAVDARMHMRHAGIGDENARRHQPREASDQNPRRCPRSAAWRRRSGSPGPSGRSPAASRSRPTNSAGQQGRPTKCARHVRPPRLFRQQPGGDDDEARLGEFRGLQIDGADVDPAMRALDLGARRTAPQPSSARRPAKSRKPARRACRGVRNDSAISTSTAGKR